MIMRRRHGIELAGVGIALLSFACCNLHAQTRHSPERAPARVASTDAESFDPMDSLLEFGVTPSDQLPPPPETNALQLLIMESSALRDPFWPVGYTPPATAATAATTVVERVETAMDEEPRWEEALRQVSVKGIMSVGGGKFMAVVNNEVVGENDTVTVTHNNRRYSWRVNSITAQGVKFRKLTASR